MKSRKIYLISRALNSITFLDNMYTEDILGIDTEAYKVIKLKH